MKYPNEFLYLLDILEEENKKYIKEKKEVKEEDNYQNKEESLVIEKNEDNKKDYLLLVNDQKHLIMNASKDFILDIINDANASYLQLYELKKVNLQEKKRYEFI